jgi:hypothetical protein
MEYLKKFNELNIDTYQSAKNKLVSMGLSKDSKRYKALDDMVNKKTHKSAIKLFAKDKNSIFNISVNNEFEEKTDNFKVYFDIDIFDDDFKDSNRIYITVRLVPVKLEYFKIYQMLYINYVIEFEIEDDEIIDIIDLFRCKDESHDSQVIDGYILDKKVSEKLTHYFKNDFGNNEKTDSFIFKDYSLELLLSDINEIEFSELKLMPEWY